MPVGNVVRQDDLRTIREERGLPLKELARMLGRKPETIRAVELMEREPLHVGMRAWGEALGLTGPQIRSLLMNCDRFDRALHEFTVERYERILANEREANQVKVDQVVSENNELKATIRHLERQIRMGGRS